MTSTIKSMTAFAKCSENSEFGTVTWEIRSVNHRNLDLSIKLPEFFNVLEMELREILRDSLKRGRIDCYLRYQPNQISNSQLQINANLLQQLIEQANQISQKISISTTIDPIRVLAWPNVLQEKEFDVKPLHKTVASLLKKTIQDLIKAREREGSALSTIINKTAQAIHLEVTKIQGYFPLLLPNERQKILNKFVEIRNEMDNNRLEQEMVIFAHKVDITEELDRLTIHLQDMNRILKDGDMVGKKLDFLIQELNRETNTIASKASDIKITKSAIEIKVLLEQIREQVQNLE